MGVPEGISEVPGLADKFDKYAIRPLKDITRAKDVNRYGALFHLEECAAMLSETPVNHFLSSDFQNARSLNLRFTRRLPTLEAVAKKRVEDYRNIIYTIDQSDKGKVDIKVDYQEYFVPSLNKNEWEDKPFTRFVENAITYFNGEFKEWLSRLIHDQAA